MNAAIQSDPPLRHPRRSLIGLVAMIFAAQLALIWLLGAHHVPTTRKPDPTPPTTLAVEWKFPLAALDDPRLFAQPNARGFSGQAWAQTPRREFHSRDWDEPYRWRPLPVAQLGNTFSQLVLAAPPTRLALAEKTVSQPVMPPATPAWLPERSTFRLEGELAKREMISEMNLPAQPATDILAASVVRVAVDSSGRVVSATLDAGSLSAAADSKALELAQAARFKPVADSRLTFGRMIFRWYTVPLPVIDQP